MIEQVLTDYLRGNANLAALLTTYQNVPAAFYQKAPDDQDPGWGKGQQYGRVIYALDMTGDPERDMSGLLAVDVQCREPQAPEDVEPTIRSMLDGRFVVSGDTTLSIAWRASNYFTEPTDAVAGVTVSFDLLEYPVQRIVNGPDPIKLLGDYVKDQYPAAVVIGHDTLKDSVIAPTNTVPFIYCRLSRAGPCSYIPDTFQTMWRTAVLQIHIVAADEQTELSIAEAMATDLTMRKRLFFPDKGPMMIDRAEIVPSTAPQRSPVLTVTGSFGIIKALPHGEPLKHTTFTDKI